MSMFCLFIGILLFLCYIDFRDNIDWDSEMGIEDYSDVDLDK